MSNRIMPFCGLVAVSTLILGCSALEKAEITRKLPLNNKLVIQVQANTFTTSTQENVTLDFTPTGNVIAAWDSRRQQNGQYGIYARLLNGKGQQLSEEVQINQHTRSSQTDPSIAVNQHGESWITWTSHNQDGDGTAIIARKFNDRLQPVSNEIAINQTRVGNQFDSAVAINKEGHALIVWSSTSSDEETIQLLGRVVNSKCEYITDEFVIGSIKTGSNHLASVVVMPDDDFMAVWARTDSNNMPNSIIAQRITSKGLLSGNEIVINEETGNHIEPSVDADDNGRFAVTWLTTGNTDNYKVVARIFDQSGNPLTDTKLISNSDDAWISATSVAMRNDGSHIITWNQKDLNQTRPIILGQRFNPAGNPVGDIFTVNQIETDKQLLQIADNSRRIAWNDKNEIAIGWSGDAGYGDSSAAGVTLIAPNNLIVEQPDDILLTMALTQQPEVPIPPIFDPNWEPLDPPLILGGDGPDFGFLGVNYTGWTPPDPEMAVGPNHVVMIINGAIAFFDKTGTLLFQDEIENSFGFWGAQGATGFVFDPECLYDTHANRFFAMACERGSDGRSYYLFAVSDDDNPVGTWHKYRVRSPIDNDIDSPNMAIDENVLYLTSDFFGPDKYGVMMIEKAPLLSGGAINSNEIVISGSGNQSMGIPIIYDSGAPAAYLVQSSEGTGNGVNFNEVRFHAIQDPLGSPTRVTVDVTVPTYSYPNQPPQAGTSARPFLFEPRFWSTMYVNGSLWAVHHVNSSRARARWYEFRMNGWPDSGNNPTLRQWGELDYGGGIHTFFPSISADAQGNACIVFSRSSTSEFISIGRAYRRHNDPLNEFRPMEFVKQSTSPYNGSRWGDYSHTEPDPASSGVFWGAHEWTDTSNSWRTWVVEVDTLPAGTELTGFEIVTGVGLSGGLAELIGSDNTYLQTRSGFGNNLTELHMLEMEVQAVTSVDSPTSLSLTIESRIDEPVGNARIQLRNWNSGQFETVGSYSIGTAEEAVTIADIDATNYINNSGQIDVSIKHTVFVPFLAFTFESFFDQVRIDVE